MLTIHVLSSESELAQVSPEWDELLGRATHSEPTQSPHWLRTWWRTFGHATGRALRIYTCRDGGRLIGIAPLVARTHWYGALPFRRFELLGSGEPERDEIASEYLGFIVEAGREREVIEALLHRLPTEPWEEFVYPRVCPEQPVTRALIEAWQERGFQVEQSQVGHTRYVPLPASFDDYLDTLSSSRRQRARRALRRFEQWTGQPAMLERVTRADSFDLALTTLVELHHERWRARGKPGAFHSRSFTDFHRHVLPTMMRRGAAELLFLRAHGRPVAALYNLIWQGRVHFYQSGRRMDVPTTVAPGLVIHLLAIRDAIERGLCEYDFLAGDVRYKEELTLASRIMVDLRVTRPGCVREAARALLWRAARTIRSATRP